jgi:hypothetical protein
MPNGREADADGRGAMRKVGWYWLIVAFLVGLAPGAGATWWFHSSWASARSALITRNSELHAENQTLLTRLNSAEASAATLSSKVEQLQASPVASTPSTTGTGTAGGGTPTGPPNITTRSATPEQATAGGTLMLTVKLTGHADKVNMRVVGAGFDKTYFLARTTAASAGEVWESSTKAPTKPGTYHYYAIAYAGGTKYPMPGTQFTFVVK